MISNTTTTIWRVRLVHAELGARVVEASCEEGGQLLAMAFGEATTTEVAEDRARRRAAQMLLETQPASAPPLSGEAVAEEAVAEEAVAEEAVPEEAVPEEAGSGEAGQSDAPDQQSPPPPPPTTVDAPVPPADIQEPDGSIGQPTISLASATPAPQHSPGSDPGQDVSEPLDWSDDLAVVEMQLERLGWDRNQESVYLERCFGYMERSRVTRYQDLRRYIDALQALSPPADPCMAPLPGKPQAPLPSREELIQNSNTMLHQLGWTTDQGRAFLRRNFGHASRQVLSGEQLMQFNQQLEVLLVTGGGAASPAS